MNRFMSVVGLLIIVAVVSPPFSHGRRSPVADRLPDRPRCRRHPTKRLNTTILESIYDIIIHVITTPLLHRNTNVSIYES